MGPGTYLIEKSLESLMKKPCNTLIKHSHYGADAGKHGYLFVGNQLVFDEEIAAAAKRL